MNENEIMLDNIRGEIMEYIRQLKFKKASFGGYDKDYVLLNIQEICNMYEKHIAKIYADNKEHIDLLNNEIFELRQKNEGLSRRVTSDPTVIEKANQAILEANSRIDAANAHIAKLQALYEEAEEKLRNQTVSNAQENKENKNIVKQDNGQDYGNYTPSRYNPARYRHEMYRRDGSGQNYDAAEEAAYNAEEADRLRRSYISDPDILAEAKNNASEIIKRANDEAEKLRAHARSEAETIIRDRRAEIRAEERVHEERMNELKDKYTKYRTFFTKMLSEVRDIEGDIEPILKRHDEAGPIPVEKNEPHSLSSNLSPASGETLNTYFRSRRS